MTKIECQAKNPASCRYHGVDGAAQVHEKYVNAKQHADKLETAILTDNTKWNDLLEARWQLDDAEEDYYATPKGQEDITAQLAAPGLDDQERYDLEYKAERGLIHLEKMERRHQYDQEAGGALIPTTSTYELKRSVKVEDNDLWPRHQGGNYEPREDGRSMKARMTKELKLAQKEGYLPKHLTYKLGVRGNRVTLEASGIHPGQMYEYYDPNDPEAHKGEYGYRPEATKDSQQLRDRMENILATFNNSQYDTIEGRTNYSHFWSHVTLKETDPTGQ